MEKLVTTLILTYYTTEQKINNDTEKTDSLTVFFVFCFFVVLIFLF